MRKFNLLFTASGLFTMAQSQSWNLIGKRDTNSKINFPGKPKMTFMD